MCITDTQMCIPIDTYDIAPRDRHSLGFVYERTGPTPTNKERRITMRLFVGYYVRCIETGVLYSDKFSTLSDAILFINGLKNKEDHFEIVREDQV